MEDKNDNDNDDDDSIKSIREASLKLKVYVFGKLPSEYGGKLSKFVKFL